MTFASSVLEAKNIVLEEGIEAFDCVLTDFNMPEQSGLDLLDWLQIRDVALSTIIVTAIGEKSLVQNSLRQGAVDYLDKPVSPEDLNRALLSGVEQTASRRRLNNTLEDIKAVARMSNMFRVFSAPKLESRLVYFGKTFHDLGGDFLDVLTIGEEAYLFLLGDVSGHDVKAGFVSAYFQGMVKGLVELAEPVELLLNRCNKVLLKEWGASQSDVAKQDYTIPISLATCAVLLDMRKGDLKIINCGMPPCTLTAKHGQVCVSKVGNPPLGWMEIDLFKSQKLPLDRWDFLYMFSDGLVEYADSQGLDLFSVIYRLLNDSSENVESWLTQHPDDILLMRYQFNSDSMANELYQPLIHEQYTGDDYDDIDRIQGIWRRSLNISIKETAGDRFFDILLCCREALLNALEHGCEKLPGKPCTFELNYNPALKRVKVRVDDSGVGHSFDIVERIEEMEEPSGEHVGLAMIEELTDDLRFENNGTSLCFEFQL